MPTGHPKMPTCIDPLDWFPKEPFISRFVANSRRLDEEHCGARRNADVYPPVPQPLLESFEVTLRVADEQRRLAGHGCVVLTAAWSTHRGKWRCLPVVHIPLEEDGEHKSTLPPTPYYCKPMWLSGRTFGMSANGNNDMVFSMWKSRLVSLSRSLSIHLLSKTLATSSKTIPDEIFSSDFLKTKPKCGCNSGVPLSF